MTARTESQSLQLAYLVSQYPALSHTFIASEIRAMRRLGARVETFSVRRYRPAELLTEDSRLEARRTTVLQHPAAVLAAVLAVVRRSPTALLRGLSAALRTGPSSPRARLWQVFYLGEALVLWRGMTARGLRHVHVHFANNGADIARLAVLIGRLVDGPGAGWRWSLAMHGSTEFEDRKAHDLAAKFGSAAAVACISDYTRSQVMSHLPPAQWHKVGLVRMGVDTVRFSPAPVRVDRDAAAPLRVLTVGRLVPVKGMPLLVDAVAELVHRGLPVALTVVGAGPLLEPLREDVRARGLDEVVRLLGPVSQDELPKLYREADVFCLPSFNEGIPVVLMEAMATGLPVVTTAITGIPELVVDHRTGLLVTPGRADLLAAALTELALDPSLSRRLGEQARTAVLRDHDSDINAQGLLDLLTARDLG